METNSSNSAGGQVILKSPDSSKKEIKKQISPSKRWCFTLNNYTQEELDTIVPIFDSLVKIGMFGMEVGKESKIPHLQGFVEFNEKLRPKSVLSIDRI